MKLYLKEKGIFLSLFILFYFIIEICTFIWVDFTILPGYFLIDLVFVLMLGGIGLLFKSNKLSIIFYTIILAFVMTLFLINATMYSVYFDLFSLQQMNLIGEANAVFQFEFLNINSIITAAVIGISYFVSVFILWKKIYYKKVEVPHYYKHTFTFLSTFLLIVLIFFSSGLTSVSQFNSSVYVTTFKRSSIERYGLLGYYFKEAELMVFGPEITDYEGEDPNQIIPYEASKPSDYHGLLEDANVITILVESLQPFAVNEVLTPNLYMITNSGLYMENNHSENKTNVSEFIAMAGNYPTVPLLPRTYEYNFSNTLPYILSVENNYTSAYFHHNLEDFYARNMYIDAMGFDEFYSHEDMFPGIDMYNWNGDYTLDSVTVEEVLKGMDFESGPFYYYWSTMIMHGPYNYGPKNKRLFSELGYFSAIDQAEIDGLWVNPLAGGAPEDVLRIRHYQAAVMDFDKALGRILEELEAAGELDNTILVLFGDHNIYYHDLHLRLNDGTGEEYYRPELYKAYLAIYNPILNEEYLKTHDDAVIRKFTSPYNIVPTILDLLGHEYNQLLFLGESVLLDTQGVFYSHKLTGFFDQSLYSHDGYEILYYKDEVSDDYLEEFYAICAEQRYRLEMINYWYDSTRTIR